MLGEMFKAILITSLAGSVLAAVITLLKPVTKRVFGYSWHYYIWLTVLFVMILPVRFTLRQGSEDIPVMNTQMVQTEQITVQTDIADTTQTANTATITAAKKATNFISIILDNRMKYLSIIWLLGMAFMLMVNINGYIGLIMKIHKNSVVISCPEASNYTDRTITVRAGKNLSSPFMLGIFRPTLVLPDKELSAQQLNNILRHEMTHFKRKDILYKWFTLLVRSVHWFNPIMYYVAREINNECEISCDLSIVSRMNGDEQMSYINTILSLVSSNRVKRVPLTTQMASGKRVLKRRFTMIKNVKKTSKLMSVISAVIAVVIFGTTVFASGVLSGLSTDDYTVELINNGEKIELINKLFSDEEIAAARAVIEEYYRAGNAKDRSAQLATLTQWHHAPNVLLASDDKSIVKIRDIRYSPSDSRREAEDYIKYGGGSVNGAKLENVIVFYMDYDVSFPEGTSEKEKGAWMSSYDNWNMILIRDSKNGKWLIDDMGY